MSYQPTTNAIKKRISQNSHGLTAGKWVYISGSSTYELADNASESTSKSVGVVTNVIDSDNFVIATSGYIEGLSNLTYGVNYLGTSGDTTSTAPSTGIIRKLIDADTTSSGWIIQETYNATAGESGSNTSITNAGTFTTTLVDIAGSSFTLPSAGTWFVVYNIFGSSSATAQVAVRIYTDADVVVDNTQSHGYVTTSGSFTLSNTAIITTTGAETFKLKGKTSTGTFTVRNVDGDTVAGRSKITWFKTSGNAPAGTLSLSNLLSASGANTLSNQNNAQTWNWGTATTQNPFTITGTALTTGSLLTLTGGVTSGKLLDLTTTATTGTGINLSVDALTSGKGINISSTATATTGSLLSITGASNSVATNGLVYFNLGGTGGNKFVIDAGNVDADGAFKLNMNSLNSATGMQINANSLGSGTVFEMLCTTTAGVAMDAPGGVHGSLFDVRLTGTNTLAGEMVYFLKGVGGNGTAFRISNSSGTGNTLYLTGAGGGRSLLAENTLATTTNPTAEVVSNTTGAVTSGILNVNATGAHTGNAINLTTATATGIGQNITTSSLTTGKALAINTTSTGLTTAGTDTGLLLDIRSTGASTTMTGSIANIIASSVNNAGNTGSVLNLKATGVAFAGKVLNISSTSTSSSSTALAIATGVGSTSLDIGSGKLKITASTNTAVGSSVLVGGTVTVSNTSVTANSKIFLTAGVAGGTQGILSVGTITAGTSFVINSTSELDTSTINWLIIN